MGKRAPPLFNALGERVSKPNNCSVEDACGKPTGKTRAVSVRAFAPAAVSGAL